MKKASSKLFLLNPFLWFLYLYSLCTPALSADNSLANTTIRFAVDDFPPWVIVAENQTIQGIDIRIARRIAKELGMQAEFILCPFARCLKMMETGKADMMLNLFRTQQREAYTAFIEPHLNLNPPKVFYLRKNDERDIDTYAVLEKMLIGYVRETQYFERFDNDKNIKKLALGSDQQLLEMLLKGRIDTFISTEDVITYWASQTGNTDKIKKASYSYHSQRFTYAGMSRKSPHFSKFKDFQTVIRSLRSSHQIAQITTEFWQEQKGP